MIASSFLTGLGLAVRRSRSWRGTPGADDSERPGETAPCERPDGPRLREPARPARAHGRAAMSAGHFSRSFHEAFGETPYGYLMTRLIECAKALLKRAPVACAVTCGQSARFTAGSARTGLERRAAIAEDRCPITTPAHSSSWVASRRQPVDGIATNWVPRCSSTTRIGSLNPRAQPA